MFDGYIAICHVLTEVVVFDCVVFGSRSEIGIFLYFDATHIVLKYFAMEFWLWIVEFKYFKQFSHQIHERYGLLHIA